MTHLNYKRQYIHRETKEVLESAGLTFVTKRHSEMIENSQSGFCNTYNQIWVRK